MQLTIHRGSHEIGGNCVEVATPTTRIVLDVGMPLVDAGREPFDRQTLRGKSVSELLAMGVLPNVRGLYGDEDSPDAILLSHAHLDHVGLLDYTQPRIPVHATVGTSKMMLAGAMFAGQKRLDRKRHRTITPGVPFQVGDLEITAYSVDHSAFDSVAFLIRGEGKTLLYSGDLRMHGRKPWMAESLLGPLAGQTVDALVMEGTHCGANRERGITEIELEEQIQKWIQSAPAIVLAAFSPMDVDRLVTYYKATRQAGRIFVADVYTAFILYLIHSQVNTPPPTKDAGIQVFYNAAFESGYARKRQNRIHEQFAEDRISLEQILAEPSRYVMAFRPSMAYLDFAGQLPRKCRCLYSYWTGYLAKGDWTGVQELIGVADGELELAHTSGHIFIDDIKRFVSRVNPAKLIPIHSFEPQSFADWFGNVQLATDGAPFSL